MHGNSNDHIYLKFYDTLSWNWFSLKTHYTKKHNIACQQERALSTEKMSPFDDVPYAVFDL